MPDPQRHIGRASIHHRHPITLTNIGEFLGGLAILVSLVYLVINVRQNTAQLQENSKVLQRAEQRATYEQHDRYRLAMQNPQTADMFMPGISGDRLTASESLSFRQLCTMICYSTQNNFDAGQRGVMDAEEWARIQLVFLSNFVETPGGGAAWDTITPTLQPEFVEAVEALRRRK